jgi:hypothetical protein
MIEYSSSDLSIDFRKKLELSLNEFDDFSIERAKHKIIVKFKRCIKR